MNQQKIKVTDSVYTSTLPNGLRVITDTCHNVESVVVAVGIKAGSRNENDKNNGSAHFLEHMAFKGTKTRTAKQISDEVEGVGGYMNAYTSKEKTVYYIKVLKEDAKLAVDILSDILQNSTLDEVELERERGVILQEFASSLDTPSDIVFDFFSEASFGKSKPLGRTIIGTKETIKSISKNDLKHFLKKLYYPQNMVIVAAGNISHEQFLDLIANNFDNLPKGPEKCTFSCSPYVGGGVVVKKKAHLEQLQFLLGFKSAPYMNIEENTKVGAVSMILGGGMSSRLFQHIREELGVAYSISTYREAYEDSGLFGVYADSSIKHLKKLICGIRCVFKDAIKKIDEDELDRVRHQQKAAILMKEESMSERVGKLISNYLLLNRYVDNKEVVDALKSLTTKEASQILHNIVCEQDSPLTLLVYGDFNSDNKQSLAVLDDLTSSNFLDI